MQRHLIFQNSAERILPSETEAAEMHEIQISGTDGTDLIVWAKDAPNLHAPILLFFHGNAGTLGHRAPKFRWFIDQGYGVVALAYRGSGGSDGSPSEHGHMQDAKALYAALPRIFGRAIDPRKVVLYGESLGTGVAVGLAANHSVGGVILEAPYTSVDDVAQSMLPIFPIKPLNVIQHRFASIDKIEHINAPLLILHGEKDRTIPIRLGKELMQRANDPKWARWYGEAGHNDLWEHGATNEVASFIDLYFKK